MARGGGPGSRFGAILLVSALTGPVLALAVTTTPRGAPAAPRAEEAQFSRGAVIAPRPAWSTEPSQLNLAGATPDAATADAGSTASVGAVPVPVPAAAPAPTPPAPTPAPSAPPATDPLSRARAALDAGVPAAWRTAVIANVVLSVDRVTASRPDGRIRVSLDHATGEWNRLVAIMAHEFGHLVAYAFGTHRELGAAPEGWPRSGTIPVEHWADCVARAWTGATLASHGQAPCDGDALGWTSSWLAAGPAAHPRTA